MRKKVLFTVIAVLAASSVFAGTLTVVSSFVSQKTWRKGLDYNNGYIYSTSNYSDNNIHIYTTVGSLVGSIPSPSSSMDLKWDGSYIWLCTFSPARVYRLTSSGSVVTSFAGPGSGYGLAWTGTYLYYSSAQTGNMIWRLTTTGSIVTSYSSGCSFVGGLDYDGTNLWVADWPSSGGGLKYMTTSGSIIDSFSTPAAARPSGVCWDGTYVWYNDYNSPNLVVRARVNFTNVTPTSMGKIKAVYR